MWISHNSSQAQIMQRDLKWCSPSDHHKDFGDILYTKPQSGRKWIWLQSKEEEQARSTQHSFCRPMTADTSEHSITKRQCKALLLHQLTKLCSLGTERCFCIPLTAITLEYLITCHISTNNTAVHCRMEGSVAVLSACMLLCSKTQCSHAHAL